jgi:TonB-like protein
MSYSVKAMSMSRTMSDICLILLVLAVTPRLAAAQDTPPKVKYSPAFYYPYGIEERKARVVMEFVVDTNGLVDPTTIKVVSATDDRFVDAVRVHIMDVVFEPGKTDGVPVRVLVQYPFNFLPHQHDCSFVVTPHLAPECADSIARRRP